MIAKQPAGALLGGLAAVTLVAMAAPVLSLHLQDAGIRDLPANVPVVRNLLDIQRGPSDNNGYRDGQRGASRTAAYHGPPTAGVCLRIHSADRRGHRV